jgi:hypothetical protein
MTPGPQLRILSILKRRTKSARSVSLLKALFQLNSVCQNAVEVSIYFCSSKAFSDFPLGQISAPIALRSEFGAMPGFTKIPFVFAAVSVAQDGVVTIDWPNLQDLDNPPSSYLLCDTPFDQGKTKKVHKVHCFELQVRIIFSIPPGDL